MIKGLKRFAAGGILLRELRGVRKELEGLKVATERLALAFEQRNAHEFPQTIQPDPTRPGTEVSYVSDAQQREFLDIEMRLTAAKGMPPTEEEIVAEFERLHDLQPTTDGTGERFSS